MISPTTGDIGIWEQMLFTHTYTRTPVSDGADDSWGQAAQTPGSALTDRPCVFAARDELRITDAGRVTISVPRIYVPASDPLVVGDQVSAIKDRLGATLLAGPLVVDVLEPHAEFGPTAMKEARLRSGDVR